jgi:hypothetical protein
MNDWNHMARKMKYLPSIALIALSSCDDPAPTRRIEHIKPPERYQERVIKSGYIKPHEVMIDSWQQRCRSCQKKAPPDGKFYQTISSDMLADGAIVSHYLPKYMQ